MFTFCHVCSEQKSYITAVLQHFQKIIYFIYLATKVYQKKTKIKKVSKNSSIS